MGVSTELHGDVDFVLPPRGQRRWPDALKAQIFAETLAECAATIKVRLSVNQDETWRRGCDEGRA